MSEKYVVTLPAEERARLETLIAGGKRAASRPVSATGAPARVYASALARPLPAVGPVINAVRPAEHMILSLLVLLCSVGLSIGPASPV